MSDVLVYRNLNSALSGILLVSGMKKTVKAYWAAWKKSIGAPLLIPRVMSKRNDMVELFWAHEEHSLSVEFWADGVYDFSYCCTGGPNMGGDVHVEERDDIESLVPYLRLFVARGDMAAHSSGKRGSSMKPLKTVKVHGLDDFFEVGGENYSLSLVCLAGDVIEAKIAFSDGVNPVDKWVFFASTPTQAIEGVLARAEEAGHPYRAA